MSSEQVSSLSDLSQTITKLVTNAAHGLVAVKSPSGRTVTGIGLQDGLIAVAHHSFSREEEVQVVTADGSEAKATLLGRDPSVDLAILKAPDASVQPLATYNSDSPKPGMLAVVVGLTADVGPSASLGIVGAVGGPRRTWRGGMLDSFLRLDVNLYPSQSGAAVIDIEGRLLGMATSGLLRHSALCVPVETIHRVAQEISKEGRIRRGYLGVGVQPVILPKTLREKLSQSTEKGVILVSVEPDSPAEKAGFQLGDILLTLGNKSTSDIDELQTALRGSAANTALEASIIRGGEPLKITVSVGERAKKD